MKPPIGIDCSGCLLRHVVVALHDAVAAAAKFATLALGAGATLVWTLGPQVLRPAPLAAPGAVANTKQLLRQLRGPVPDLRDAAAQAFAQGLRSAEAAQGLAAFARKQPAPWTLSGKDPV